MNYQIKYYLEYDFFKKFNNSKNIRYSSFESSLLCKKKKYGNWNFRGKQNFFFKKYNWKME